MIAFNRHPRFKADTNKVWSQMELVEGAKLAAHINARTDDAVLRKAGYGQDSCGAWFLNGSVIPTPIESKQPGVGVIPYSPLAAVAAR